MNTQIDIKAPAAIKKERIEGMHAFLSTSGCHLSHLSRMLHNKGTSCFYKERIKGTEKEGVLCNFSPDVDVDMTIDRVQRC